MAVNRRHRNELADAVATYMRGEIGWDTLQDRISAACPESSDPFVHFMAQDLRDLPKSLSEEMWNRLRRELAFLRTDFTDNRASMPQHVSEPDELDMIPLAEWYIFAFAIALAVVPLAGWLPLKIVWVLTFIPFQIRWWRIEAANNTAWGAELARRMGFEPFTGEEEWLAHVGLLEPLRIPAFDPRIHNRPTFRSISTRVHNAWLWGLGLVLIRCAQMSVVVWWPYLLVVTTLFRWAGALDRGAKRTGTSAPNAAPDGAQTSVPDSGPAPAP
jgi:hypothetical protein